MKIAVFLLLMTATACVVCTRPSASSLWSTFPTGRLDDVVTAMGLPDQFWYQQNNEAIRMSKAFIDLGLTLDHTQAAACANASYAGVRGSRGIYTNKEVFITPEFFSCYLRGIWGPPDRVAHRHSFYTFGTKGILIFTGCGYNDHIALFKLTHCPISCHPYYFLSCDKSVMYHLP